MDEIIIENLRVYAYHGVHKEENENGQNFYVNAVLYTDTKMAGEEDDLEVTTNYSSVCKFIHKFVSKNVFKLIETVAEKTAEAVLINFPLLDGIMLQIKKPEAPIKLEFQSTSVKITRMWHDVYLSTGSNIGNKQKTIEYAIKALDNDKKCKIKKASKLFRSTAYGEVTQDDFLNGAILMKTLYTPNELLRKIHEIEISAKRERKQHWGPRTLDLDIIFYDDLIICTDSLQIPHVDMQNRDFVLQPLSQIAPYFVHPILKKTVQQLYEDVKKSGEKYIIE